MEPTAQPGAEICDHPQSRLFSPNDTRKEVDFTGEEDVRSDLLVQSALDGSAQRSSSTAPVRG